MINSYSYFSDINKSQGSDVVLRHGVESWIYCWVCQWNNAENWTKPDEIMIKLNCMAYFFYSRCTTVAYTNCKVPWFLWRGRLVVACSSEVVHTSTRASAISHLCTLGRYLSRTDITSHSNNCRFTYFWHQSLLYIRHISFTQCTGCCEQLNEGTYHSMKRFQTCSTQQCYVRLHQGFTRTSITLPINLSIASIICDTFLRMIFTYQLSLKITYEFHFYMFLNNKKMHFIGFMNVTCQLPHFFCVTSTVPCRV